MANMTAFCVLYFSVDTKESRNSRYVEIMHSCFKIWGWCPVPVYGKYSSSIDGLFAVFGRCRSVMWSETVGLTTRPIWDQKIGLGHARCGLGLGFSLAHCGLGFGLGLAGLVLCCETRSCHARRHNDLQDHGNFSNTIYSFILCLEHHYCRNQQWRLPT